MLGTLRKGYGHARSVRSHCPTDGQGQPTPWFTYPAIEFLAQFDFGLKRVFEYGAGNSTLYWSSRAASVVSVESAGQWYRDLADRIPKTVQLVYLAEAGKYAAEIANHPGGFDIIIVDGIERMACSRIAPDHLREGGMIILDNSDWHPQCAAILRDAGLLQVDMTGFGPVNDYTWTTSFFFHRQFDFPMRTKVRPMSGIGSIPKVAN